MATYRDKRAASLLKQEICLLLQRELKDPRISGFITVTDVVVPKDLRTATVYISILGNEKTIKGCLEGLESAKGFIRTRLGKILSLRRIPEIRFKQDLSLQTGSELYHKIVALEEEQQMKEMQIESSNEEENI